VFYNNIFIRSRVFYNNKRNMCVNVEGTDALLNQIQTLELSMMN